MKVEHVVVGAIFAGLLVGGVTMTVHYHSRPKADCKALTTRAAISTRAAELCTGELVACQMTFEQVQAVLADQQRAKEVCE